MSEDVEGDESVGLGSEESTGNEWSGKIYPSLLLCSSGSPCVNGETTEWDGQNRRPGTFYK